VSSFLVEFVKIANITASERAYISPQWLKISRARELTKQGGAQPQTPVDRTLGIGNFYG